VKGGYAIEMRSSAPYRGVDDVTAQTLPLGRCLNSACVCDATHVREVATVCGRRQPSKASTIVRALLVTCALMHPLYGVTASPDASSTYVDVTPHQPSVTDSFDGASGPFGLSCAAGQHNRRKNRVTACWCMQ
jgi:hypothetical protein